MPVTIWYEKFNNQMILLFHDNLLNHSNVLSMAIMMQGEYRIRRIQFKRYILTK